jgi:cyclophilin family peptidyl-prolyl cis-trans isomerase
MKPFPSFSLIASLAFTMLLGACSKNESAPTPVGDAAKDLPLEYPTDPVAVIKTNMGTIRAELFKDKAPKTVANFIQYVEKKHFDNTIFHRVIADFMIQGGGFENQNGSFVEKATLPPVVNEAHNGLKNRRGTLAMARTGDPHSATSQFFINVVDNNKLNLGDAEAVSPDGYAVFGKVLSGLDVVEQIRQVPTESGRLTSRLPDGKLEPGSHPDVPVKAVIIESITLEAK